MKIINKIRKSEEHGRVFYSFEYFPPKTEIGVQNLYDRMERMATLDPLFCDVTWGADGKASEKTLDISVNAKKFLGLEVLMHMTCTNASLDEVRGALQKARDAGIQNILALRGDEPKDAKEPGPLRHAVDLVNLISKEFPGCFGVAVAGHPEKHPDAPTLEEDIQRLKEKVDAGADFVISQLFFSADAFLHFVDRCRAAGITCPIIPGIMPIQNYNAFRRMVAHCRVSVPDEVKEALQPIEQNDAAVKAYGVKLAVNICRKLLNAGTPGLHFYTLNLEKSVRRILDQLHLVSVTKELPWRPSALERREKEDVRPIFWAMRPKSYLYRTDSWDDFPNGRWGDKRSPAFGEMTDSHYFNYDFGSVEERKTMWGEAPLTVSDISEVFVGYINGSIGKLPWSEGPVRQETLSIQSKLVEMNKNGFFTINSQPRINAARSDDKAFGWGAPGGYVYQKAYVECFASPEDLKILMEEIELRDSLRYIAVDAKGNKYSNHTEQGVTAVTWGVFPNEEVLQPTVVDVDSFLVWKKEAFQLWLSSWASLYDEESASNELIHNIHGTYFLVSVVDNDFINGDIWSLFEACVKRRTREDERSTST